MAMDLPMDQLYECEGHIETVTRNGGVKDGTSKSRPRKR